MQYARQSSELDLYTIFIVESTCIIDPRNMHQLTRRLIEKADRYTEMISGQKPSLHIASQQLQLRNPDSPGHLTAVQINSAAAILTDLVMYAAAGTPFPDPHPSWGNIARLRLDQRVPRIAANDELALKMMDRNTQVKYFQNTFTHERGVGKACYPGCDPGTLSTAKTARQTIELW